MALRITKHDWPADNLCNVPRSAETVYQVHAEGFGIVSPEFSTEREARKFAANEYPGETVQAGLVPDDWQLATA
jgi:hypothetical protein